MTRQACKRWLRSGGAFALFGAVTLGSLASSARADDEQVVHRLTKYGKLSSSQAHQVIQEVTGRMKRAADITSSTDPLRMAVSNALFHTSVPPDTMSSAKVRLRLYAGLNHWALENLFAPRPGAMMTCTTQFGLGQQQCEALLAAGGNTSPAEAARLGAGMPIGGGAPAGGGYAQPAYGQAAPAYGGFNQPSRFGSYNSGYAVQRPVQRYGAYGARPAAAPAWNARAAAPAQNAWAARPAAAPQPVAAPRPMVAPRPMAPPPPNPAVVANRKAAYEARRQAYLERQRQEMEARKAKILNSTEGTTPVQRGPSSADEAAVAGLSADTVAKPVPAAAAKSPAKSAAAPAAVASAAAPASAEAAPAAPAKSSKGTLDNDFLSGLMDDPLGKNK